ncbi:helix-turn-helix transcriptional regulator [Oscillochloris sp. ZM17-4]|uniref:helix-turn-helix domain-containing protein n=1 Tax=Oscillochloris sp. ZM17-4 TaxID=2866714 RepID=UPI001C73A3C5|nr:helix-turn-helix transcriptional regulator [Oscillochloris sp. ZM17-4]MBX0328566.1 helix-turn-helix transcriptional regulator [Oscillochloris sp. ZM17-4]
MVMIFRCPYIEVCRAQAMREFAATPELAVLFARRLQCGEQDSVKAQRCATMLGLAEQEFPTLGTYVQAQRRQRELPQGALAAQAGIDLQELRDLELNKLDPQRISGVIIERLASALAAPVEYLKALARITAQAGSPRHGTVFARSILVDEQLGERP